MESLSTLIESAWQGREKAYAPYSQFKVGAALLCGSGEIYQGCNIENISFGLTNCAERTALFQAIVHGEKEFVAMVVCADTPKLTAPCGACRQVLLEFAPKMAIIMVNKQGDQYETTVDKLMPIAFDKINQ